MGKIGFYIFYGLNWLITLLPLRLLYLSSDVLFFFFYYFPSYRKRIVEENLKNSFPEKSEKELKSISRKFYRHLSDLFVETLKITHMSNSELKRRFVLKNPEILKGIYDSGRDVIVVLSHYNNWELIGVTFPLYTNYRTFAVYKPIQNKIFQTFMNNLRLRNGEGLAPMNKIIRTIAENKSKNVRSLYGFIADQTPSRPEIKYYTRFLNQDTPVFLGIEKIAEKYDMALFFLNVQKVKRGYYEATLEMLYERTKGIPEYKVTDCHVRRLEEIIKEKPEYWIWSHRRWKYKKMA